MASDSCQIEEIRARIKICQVPSRLPRNGHTNVPSQQLLQRKNKNSLDNNCMPGPELYTTDSGGFLFCQSYFIQSLRFVCANAKIRPDAKKKKKASAVGGEPLFDLHAGYCSFRALSRITCPPLFGVKWRFKEVFDVSGLL